MARPRGLGRGLSALIPDSQQEERSDEGRPRDIALELIEPNPFQPRRSFPPEALQELAASIKTHGVLEPVLVRKHGAGYQLIVGERRLRACQLAQVSHIPAVVGEWDDRAAMEIALVENLQRQDLNPLEEARAFRRLVEDFRWTQEDVADRVGKSRPYVANYLRLLQLEEEIQQALASGILTVAHAKELLGVDPPRRASLATQCIREGWTVRQLHAATERPEGAPGKAAPIDAHMKVLEMNLRRRFGVKVALRGSPERGRIEIPYRTLEDLERIVEMLHGNDREEDHGNFVV